MKVGTFSFCWQRDFHQQQVNVPKMLRGTGGEMHMSPQSMGSPSSNRADIKLPTTQRKYRYIAARTLPDFLHVSNGKIFAGDLAHGLRVNQRKPDLKSRNQNSGDVLAETRFSLWCLGGWILGRV